MRYQAHFQHIGGQTVKSEVFQTFHEAQTCAAQHHAEIGAEVVLIVEIDQNGGEGRSHWVTVVSDA